MSNPKKTTFCFWSSCEKIIWCGGSAHLWQSLPVLPEVVQRVAPCNVATFPNKITWDTKKPAQRTQNGSQSPVLKCTLILVTEWWLANFSDVTLANEMKNMSTTHWVVWVVVINVIWWWKLFGESPRAPFSVSNFWEIPYWHYCRTVADKCFLQSWAVHNFVIQLITKHSE